MRKRSAIRFLTTIFVAALLSCGEDDSPLTPIGDGNDTTPLPGDTTAPSRITEIAIAYDEFLDEAHLEWTAPYDDSLSQPVDSFDIRFSYTRGYEPPSFWDLSTAVDNPPGPLAPGTLQRYQFTSPNRGRDLYVGIRSYDEAGNISPRSEIVWTHIDGFDFAGRCMDPLTALPVEGLAVQVSGLYDLVTDAGGEFSKTDLFPGGVQFSIENGTAATVYHHLDQLMVLGSDTTHTFAMITFREPVAPVFAGNSLLGLLKTLTRTNFAPHILAKYHVSPVPCYFPSYVNSHGVDYAAGATAAAQRWMDATGLEIFTFVDAPPDTGIVLVHRPNADMDPLLAVTRPMLGSDRHPIRHVIEIIDDFKDTTFFYKVMLHELGHTFSFDHIRHTGFIMYGGQPLPDDITRDEADLVILYQSLPVRVDMSIYDESNPPFDK